MMAELDVPQRRWFAAADSDLPLEAVWAEGFRSVVQLRTHSGGDSPPLDRKAARRLGLDCLDVDVPLEEWSIQEIEERCREATTLTKPVYVFCRSSRALDVLAFRRLLKALGQA